MLHRCESCGQCSFKTVYEVTTQHELCPPCYFDLINQLAAVSKKRSSHHQLEPIPA